MKSKSDLSYTPEYKNWLSDLKQKFRQAQIKTAVRVNSALLEFYWQLGVDIVEKQKKTIWGNGFLAQLSADMMIDFPYVTGFSKRNLERIRKWYLFYNHGEIVATQVLSQLVQVPWGQNLVIISKCETNKKALFYIHKIIENGWGRTVLIHQIESGFYGRSGKSITNSEQTLPKPQSDLAKELLKDPYNFEFLTLTEDYHEWELDKALVDHIAHFLLELGAGFAFVGRQYYLEVGESDYYLDLLFYHISQRCWDSTHNHHLCRHNYYFSQVH